MIWQRVAAWAGLGMVVCMTGTGGYWVMQPDPEILPAVLPDGNRDLPITNRNVDAKGVKLVGDKARFAIAPKEWVPVPVSTFKPGETMYILRNDCFFNKLADPVLSREWVCQVGGNFDAGTVTPPKLTPTGQCSRANFATLIRPDLPAPNTCVYNVKARFYKNPLQRSVETPFSPVTINLE
jgi:hypothetical protein